MAAPHIVVRSGDLAPTVLVPGDPKRAQCVTELLMGDTRLVTDVHGMPGSTGTVNGRPLSVMGSGMGQPSFTIYATELFSQSGVGRVIRVGTADVLSLKVKAGDVIVTTSAHAGSSMSQLRVPGVNFSAVAGFRLVSTAYQVSQPEGAQAGGAVHLDTAMSRDHFCFTPQGQTRVLVSYRVLGVEMEAVAPYEVAAEYGKQVSAILTVSDHLLDHSSDMSAAEYETRFTDPLCLAVTAAHG